MLGKNNKWYRGILQVQLIVFAAMHLILGMYFAFVSSMYANHPGFSAKIEDHRNLDQIFAIVCFVLFVLWLNQFMAVRKNKKVSVLYYISMVVSVALPFVYFAMSDAYIVEAMRATLETNYTDIFAAGKGEADAVAYWAGFEYGLWAEGAEAAHDSIVAYLGNIGVESGAEVELAKFDLAGLIDQFRDAKESWNKFELYAIINAAVSAVFVVCTVIFVPLKKSKLFKK